MVTVRWSNQVLRMRHPYLVIGPGLDVPGGVPRQLAKPDTPACWDGGGQGTAFRIQRAPEVGQGYAVNVFWGLDDELGASFPDEPVASGLSTVHLDDPTGTFAFGGAHADGTPLLLQIDSDVITYRWSARSSLGLAQGDRISAPIETVTVLFQ